ncbi:MAG TPA: ribosome assembly RNA-binding protein YhbY [Crenotrichaceae bacterium]|nr:ribosome assembly RNA-binding protein YhbY [Crenotrichaceae bacterium]
MALTTTQKKQLRTQAHALKPVVTTGQSGLTDAVLAEIEIALDHHELIKVKVRVSDREDRKQMIQRIESTTQSENILSIGQVAVLYRENPDKNK